MVIGPLGGVITTPGLILFVHPRGYLLISSPGVLFFYHVEVGTTSRSCFSLHLNGFQILETGLGASGGQVW